MNNASGTPKNRFMRRVVGLFNVRAFLLILLGFVLSLYVAWMITASFGYGYSFWYGFYDSEEHIAQYAPKNRFRQGFETTSIFEHKALFQQIVDSVHNDGKGLNDISYEFSGREIPLLHRAEIIHLQDVANLINQLHGLCIVLCAVFLSLYVQHWLSLKRHGNLIDGRSQLVIISVLFTSIALAFFMWGAKDIFYQMHILIFPADHQWFFYYQDSLMSTMMKAPDLFAGIAVQILLSAFVVLGFGFWLNHHLLKKALN